MCIIASKGLNVKFPTKETLQICWMNNPDGAGYMFTIDKKVHIRKGFMTFEDFWTDLQKTRNKYGDKIPYVMHFRIGTQGGNIAQNTHPFPLSSKMDNLKKLTYKCNTAIAHNGIISLTSESDYGYYSNYSKGWSAKNKVDYSDTMKFITDYLSLIIQSKDWYKSEKTKLLIERLIDGSRLAILDGENHIEYIGKWYQDNNGVWYSNENYKQSRLAASPKKSSTSTAAPTWQQWCKEDEWDVFFNENTKQYDFDESYCPGSWDGDDFYCADCSNCNKCSFYKDYVEEQNPYLDGWND